MATVRLHPDATAAQVMRTVRETFESRDYRWDQTDTEHAVASEGGRPVSTGSLPVSQRVRVGIGVDVRRGKLVLTLETTGAAYSAAGGGFVYLRLASRYRKLVSAVRADLAAAALA